MLGWHPGRTRRLVFCVAALLLPLLSPTAARAEDEALVEAARVQVRALDQLADPAKARGAYDELVTRATDASTAPPVRAAFEEELAGRAPRFGDEARGLDLARDAVSWLARTRGPDDRRLVPVQRTRSRLAGSLGVNAEAVDAAEDALRITRLGKPTPTDVATDENLLGQALMHVARYIESERHLMAASAAIEHAPRSSVLAGEIWTNLGDLSLEMGYPQGARRWLDRAQDALSGAGHDGRRTLVRTYERIAQLAHSGFATDEALRFGGLALSLAIEEYGPDHEEVGRVLASVGTTTIGDGRCPDADPLLQRSIDVLSARLGPDHPDLASPRIQLGACFMFEGRPVEASEQLKGAFRAEQRRLEALAPRSRPQDLRRYLDKTRDTTSLATAIALMQGAPPEVIRDSFSVVLARKSLDMDVQRAEARAADARDVLARLTASRGELARALLQGAPSPEEVATLERATDRLELELGRVASASPAASRLVRAVDVADVARALPAGSALVELSVFVAYGGASSDERLAAYVLRPDGTVQVKDLGMSGALGLRVTALRTLVQGGQPASEALQQGFAAFVQPWVDAVDKTDALFIAADGPLTLIPFEILVGSDGKPLLDRARITYLTSGRDLVDLAQPRPLRHDLGNALLVGDPDYDRAIVAGTPASARQSLLGGVRWPRLPGTAQEVQTLATLFPGATVRLGTEAGEGVLASAGDKRLVHLATHGFFLDSAGALAANSRGLVLDTGDPGKAGVDPASPGRTRVVESLTDHPEIRSGLVLAGANTGGGYLTASQLEGLDLTSADLVVLSACETGVGEISSGLGVTGLRRSLAIAGARSEVISLWKVDDAATAELMKQFYGNVSAGMDRSEALRKAKVSVRSHPEWSAPYFWGAFQLFGDWRPIVEPLNAAPLLKVVHRAGCACTAAHADDEGAWPLAGAGALGLLALLRRRRLGTVACALLVLAGIGLGFDREARAEPPATMAEANALDARGNQAVLQGDYTKALALLSRALRIEPDNDSVLTAVATVSHAVDPRRGRAEYTAAIDAALSVGARFRAQRSAAQLDDLANQEDPAFRAAYHSADARLGSKGVSEASGEVDTLAATSHAQMDQGNYPAAIALLTQAEAMCRTKMPDDVLRLVRVRGMLALALAATGHPEGVELLQEGIAKLAVGLGKDNPHVLMNGLLLAQVLGTLGRKDEAIALYESIVADASQLFGKDSAFALGVRSNLIYTYARAGKERQAITLAEHTIGPCRKRLGAHSATCGQIAETLAVAQFQVGNMAAARQAATAALAEEDRMWGLGGANVIVPHAYGMHPERASVVEELSLLVHIDLGPGKHDPLREQEAMLLERQRAFGRNAMPSLRLEMELAILELQQGRRDAGTKRLLDLHHRADATYGPYSPTALDVALGAVGALSQIGAYKDVEALAEETRVRVSAVMGPNSPPGMMARFNEGVVKMQLARPDGARIMREAAAQAEAVLGASSPLAAGMRQQVNALPH